ncbi:hypothetical protein LEN26_012399 [Aphanomyces euteiches]|nr:hypothetical protein LEN26_012399 [Aphanomyces euteiches]
MVHRSAISNSDVEAFHQALCAGDTELMTSMLVNNPMLVNKKTTLRKYALMIAAVADKAVEMMDFLRERRADVDSGGDHGHKLLLFAAEHGASPDAWAYLMKWREESKLKSKAMTDLITHVNSNPDIEEPALDLAVRGRNWKLAEHLLAQHDAEDRPRRVLALLEDVLWCHDEVAALAFLRLQVVQRSLQDPRRHLFSFKSCSTCVRLVVSNRSVVVVEELERYELFRSFIFAYCCQSAINDRPLWAAIMKRFREDETWRNSREAYLVQRRKIGLPDHIGKRMAEFLFALDTAKIVQEFWRPPESDCGCGCDDVDFHENLFKDDGDY